MFIFIFNLIFFYHWQDNAQKVAEFLASHPRVKRVNYAGLPDHPGRALHYSQVLASDGTLATVAAITITICFFIYTYISNLSNTVWEHVSGKGCGSCVELLDRLGGTFEAYC